MHYDGGYSMLVKIINCGLKGGIEKMVVAVGVDDQKSGWVVWCGGLMRAKWCGWVDCDCDE